MGINLPQNPAITLLDMYPKDAQLYYKDICSTIFIAALFLKTRTWKQLRCPSTEEQIKKIWHIYILEYYSAVKNNVIEISMQMDGTRKKNPSEVTQT